VVQTLIALNAVLVDRAEEFEDWLRTVVAPAVREQRPDLDGRWRVLRATEPGDGTVVLAFVCEGGVEEDWELRPYLENPLGPDGAERALEHFAAMLRDQEQQSWFFTPVRLGE
jgi:hypothetical protein